MSLRNSKDALRMTALAAAALTAASLFASSARAEAVGADQGSAWLARAMAAQAAAQAEAAAQADSLESAQAPAASAEAPASGAWAARAVQAGVRPVWMEERFSLTIQDHPLPEVLTEFAAAAGVPLRVGGEVPQNAKVNARFEGVTGAEFLDRVARDHGLDWRYDGGLIEVSSISERVTRLVALKGVSVIDLERAMRRLGIWEDKFRPKVVDGAIAHMNGPPRYVAAMETVLEEMVVARAEAEAAARTEAAQAQADREAIQSKARAEQEAAQARAAAQAREAAAQAQERAWRSAQPPRVVRGGAWN